MIKIEKDTKVWDQIKKNLLKSNTQELQIGFFPEAKYGPDNDNLQVAQIAQFNEEGTETNPPRPFMRVGFLAPIRKGIYDSYFAESIERIAEGKSSFIQEYVKLGPMFVNDLKEVIEKWDTPPNSPRTIERKGFDNPLIDSGLMHDSVDFKVEKKGSNAN